ncbi:MAG: glycerol-3-phosphate acyltransferase [Anaerolineae bacterium]|nr:glycerol-3-phosphate acyltransferase [Anaerolineae bacterium]
MTVWSSIGASLAAVLVGYLLGSVPSGWLIGKAHGIDVRHFGSGRTGGSNVFRSLGWRAAAITGLSDILKGALAVWLARWLFGNELAAALAGAAAVVGHNWPVTLRFRGGAGGATAGAALCALSPAVGLVIVPLAVFMLFGVRYASLATLTAALGGLVGLFVRWYILGDDAGLIYVLAFGLPVVVAVIIGLRPNITRLLQGREKRLDFSRLKNMGRQQS